MWSLIQMKQMISLIKMIIRLDYIKRWPECFAFRKYIQIYNSLSVPISKLGSYMAVEQEKVVEIARTRSRRLVTRMSKHGAWKIQASWLTAFGGFRRRKKVDRIDVWSAHGTNAAGKDSSELCFKSDYVHYKEVCSDCFQMKIGWELQSWRDWGGDFWNLAISHRVSSEALAGPNSNTLVS